MLKKLLLANLIFVMGFIFLSCTDEIVTTETLTTEQDNYEGALLYVHYFRFDENYEPWSLWLWQSEPDDSEGAQYFFEGEDDFGVHSAVPIEGNFLEGATSIGIIVRDDDWGKDVNMDRFIDMSTPDENGDVHVYLVENTVEIAYSEDDVNMGDRINSSQFTDETIIEFKVTTAVTQDQVTVLKNDVPVSISSFSMTENEGMIEISDPVNLNNVYHLQIEFDEENIFKTLIRFDGFYDSETFNDAFYYEGELGAIYTNQQTTFRLWAPISQSVVLNLYEKGHGADEVDYDGIAGVDNPYDTITMTKQDKGVFEVVVTGDLDGKYYTYTITNDDQEFEVIDPYAFSSGVNGERGMVIDFSQTNPSNWEYGARPDTITNYTDAIIYEIHVRDLTSHESWNGTEANRGKFLGLTERGTTYQNVSTGLDHIIDLGVTHVQFVPIFDHGIIDETRLNDESYFGIHDGIFNWGYMPENFNVIEGSYSTDPYNGHTRVEELKTMIQTFHDNNLRIIMDVVYNHTGKSADSNFDRILPGYYFRMTEDGGFSNGSGTGNETASERAMVRKYIVDSVLFWAEEYNIDGFRFDLMKLHDIETMNAVVEALHAIDPTIMVYGEPWDAGGSMLPEYMAAYKATLNQMPGVGIFNDNTRDGVKGSVFNAGETGFVQGNNSMDNRLIDGIIGANSPSQTINYVTAHDNNTLFDKLRLSTDILTIDDYIKMQRQANAIILFAEGIPFLHGGVEIMRTKPCVVAEGGENTCDPDNLYDHNSYRSPDETNQFDWQWKVDYYDTFEYYQSLIRLRKEKDIFRLPTSSEVNSALTILVDDQTGLVAYLLEDATDYWKTTYVIHNNGSKSREYTLVEGTSWNVVVNSDEFGDWLDNTDGNILSTITTYNGGTTITLEPNDTLVLYSTEIIE
ncbi:MAG: type I pullulanase [Tenericutes bacterium]|jgi:pullulanase|nr:type I pullulanase [Mycoplasmatota bacterium]